MKKIIPTKLAVHRLFPEVLSRIFRALVNIDPPTKKENGTHLGWIHVSHVSQPWRRAAIGDAMLWTTVSAEFAAPLVKEMIRRSKSMPINVICEGEEILSIPFIAGFLAPDQLVRLKTLRLCPNKALSEAFIGLLDKPTPLLEELALGSQHDRDCRHLPAALFASTLPRLRKLTLQGWMPSSWDALYLRNLTSLSIHAPYVSKLHSLPATKLLEILSRCPKLETIELRRVVEPLDAAGLLSLSSNNQIVDLPCLAQVVLEWTWQAITVNSLFDHLQIPPTCKIHMKFDHCLWSTSSLHGLLALFSGNTSTWNPLRELSLDASPTGVVLVANDTSNEKCLALPDDAKYTIEWTGYMLRGRGLLLAICEELCLADVAVLKISADTRSFTKDKDVLKRFLSGFRAVKTLVLSKEEAVDCVVSVLAEAQSGSVVAADHIGREAVAAEVQNHTLLLPSLQALVLEAVSLDQYGEGEEMVGDKVARMLQIRRSLGAKVRCELHALPFEL
ncbi:hypothetical protein EWM64_g1510 [Hericium alpestre]|uniref:F-box domain-containing protein n=1 Tax=Hericium alpestre TaxID=135208 RepID=A0A4Z0A8A6_9AGAM|nr:hypothetical protein EWM64_g1510 [Hericium alpestre]